MGPVLRAAAIGCTCCMAKQHVSTARCRLSCPLTRSESHPLSQVPHFTHPMNLFNAETYARALATTTSSEDAVPENVR